MKYILSILLLISCAAEAQTWTIGTNVGANGGYPVKPAHFIDLSNFAGRQKNKPAMMYDAFGYTNPAYGNLQFTVNAQGVRGDTTPFMPENFFPEFYINGSAKATTYQGNRGCRVIYDWSGDKDMFDTSHRTTIKALYGAENSFDAGDTLYFYNVDFLMSLAADQRAKYLARPDSLLTPVAKLTTKGQLHQWTSITSNFTCRYMLIRAVLHDHGAYQTTESFQEIAFYGTRPSDSAAGAKRPTAANYSGPMPKKQTFNKFDGTDLIQGIRPDTLKYNGTVRIYGGKNYWANAVTGGGSASTETYAFDHFADIGPTQYPQFKAAGQKFWWSIRGVSAWFAANYSSAYEQPVDIDHQTDEGEYGLNFTREARFYFHYAAKWGSVAVSSAFTPGWNGSDAGFPNGQNVIFGVEPNNEYEFKGITPLMVVNHVNAVYDGYESRYGSHTGIKNADSTFLLIMPASVERDTCYHEALIWLSRFTRTDKKVIFDWFNFHHYPCDLNDVPGAATYQQQLGTSGRSPEKDHLYGDNLLYTKFMYNLLDGDTVKQITNSETGYDNIDTAQHTPVGNPGWESNYSYHNLAGVTIPTYTALQSKAVVMSRLESIQDATIGYQQEFAFSNSDLGTVIQNTIYTSPGMTSGYNGGTFTPSGYYPWWFYHGSKQNVLRDYYPDSVYTTFGDTALNILRWKSDIHTDSVIYEIWKGTTTNTTIAGQTLSIPGLLNSTVNVFKSSFVSTTPIATTTTASAGVITYTATEEPKYYRANVSGAGGLPPSCTTNINTTGITQTAATFNFNPASGSPTGYAVWVDGSFVSNTTSSPYSAGGFTANTTHSWYVVPFNGFGSATGCSGSATSFTTLPDPPSCTTNLTPADGSTTVTPTSANLSWNVAAGLPSGYNVYVYIFGGSPGGSPTYVASGASQLATTLTASTHYSYFVVPFNTGGIATGCASNFTSFFTAAASTVTYLPCAVFRK